ncbi:MAG: hypothetical protein ACFB14_09295 [Leptolyngbyaceae cyanobacterium]
MKAIAIVGHADQSKTLLADLLHWHGLSVFQVDDNETLLPVLSFISPELIIVRATVAAASELVCDRIKNSTVLSDLPVIVCTDQGSNSGSADAYLYSPYTAEEIFANIQTLRPLAQPVDSVSARLDA